MRHDTLLPQWSDIYDVFNIKGEIRNRFNLLSKKSSE